MENTANVEHLPGAILEPQAGPERRILINTEQTVDPETSPVLGPEAQNRPSTPPQCNLENRQPCFTDLYITYGACPCYNNNGECYICLEAITPTDETLTHKKCRLSFCRACLETWLGEGNNTCPNDREPILALETPHPTYANLYITYGASSRNNDMECPICQEDIASTDETLTHETCRLSFCRACFETWLEGGNAACPNCRVPLPAKDGESRGPRNYPNYYSDEELDSENETDTESESGSYWESDWDSDASGSSSGWETDSDSGDDETGSGDQSEAQGDDSDDDHTIYMSLERYAQVTTVRSLW